MDAIVTSAMASVLTVDSLGESGLLLAPAHKRFATQPPHSMSNRVVDAFNGCHARLHMKSFHSNYSS